MATPRGNRWTHRNAPFTDHTDPRAFDGLTVQHLPDPRYSDNLTHLCAKCKGHGGYRIYQRQWKGHIDIQCNNCDGWGYVTPTQGDHIHIWKELPSQRMFDNPKVCTSCGAGNNHDSSD